MSKPSEQATFIDHCPIDNRPAYLVEYLPQDPQYRDRLELVIHHGILDLLDGVPEGQRAIARNDFHYTGEYRKTKNGEIQMTYRANPHQPPGPDSIRRLMKKFGGNQTRLVT